MILDEKRVNDAKPPGRRSEPKKRSRPQSFAGLPSLTRRGALLGASERASAKKSKNIEKIVGKPK